MTIDVHSHFWRFPEDFSSDFIRQAHHARVGQVVDLRGIKLLPMYAGFSPDDPRIDVQQIEAMIQRDSLKLLGLEK